MSQRVDDWLYFPFVSLVNMVIWGANGVCNLLDDNETSQVYV